MLEREFLFNKEDVILLVLSFVMGIIVGIAIMCLLIPVDQFTLSDEWAEIMASTNHTAWGM